MASVELRNVTRTYGSVHAVSGLSLNVEHGEFVALLGPSGCGKTTTLQMLAGFVEPSAGDILIGGVSVRGIPPHKRNIGVVFQSYALFPHLSVFDNVAFGLRMRKAAKSDIDRRVKSALALVQLTGLEDRFPRALSGGQQQRVALARALVIEPAVLLLDEPLSNLDANLREQMRFEIRDIQQRIGITTIFVTHDQTEAMAAADRLVVMKGGTISQIGTPRQIYEQPVDSFVANFIGHANLLPGEILDVDAQLARVKVAEATDIFVKARDAHAGQAAKLVLRPEELHISSSRQPDRNNLPGRISRVHYLGSVSNIGFETGGLSLTVLVPRGGDLLETGAEAFLHWPKGIGVLLPEKPE